MNDAFVGQDYGDAGINYETVSEQNEECLAEVQPTGATAEEFNARKMAFWKNQQQHNDYEQHEIYEQHNDMLQHFDLEPHSDYWYHYEVVQQPGFSPENELWHVTDMQNLPRFPDEVYSKLPPLLQEVMAKETNVYNRDIILLGSLAAVSSLFHNVWGLYGELPDVRKYYPNLLLFVAGHSGSGKGAVVACKELVVPYNEEWQKNHHRFLVAGNTTTSQLYMRMDEDQGRGLIFESEAKALIRANRNKRFGDFTYLLCKIFQNEEATQERRTQDHDFYCEKPRYSIVLTGTPDDVPTLVDNEEDGLLGRFIFYYMGAQNEEFADVLGATQLTEADTHLLRGIGQRIHEALLGKQQREVQILRKEWQREHFQQVNNLMKTEFMHELGQKREGIFNRNAVIAFKLMMTLTRMRALSDPKLANSEKLEIHDDDYSAAVVMARTLQFHMAYTMREINRPRLSGDQLRLLDELPTEFTKTQYEQIARSMGISPGIYNKWLPRKDGNPRDGLIRTGQGRYKKV